MIALFAALMLPVAHAKGKAAEAPPTPIVVEQAPMPDAAKAAPPTKSTPREKAPIPVAERLTAGVVVQVDDKDAAQAKAIAATEALGGWFSALGAESVTLRVPAAKLPTLVEQVRALGFVVDRSMNREELGPRLADARAAVAARREVLARYYEVLGNASADSVVAVESEIDRVIREVEAYEGQIRAMEDRAAFAQVDVNFRFRDRSPPAPTGQSSFAWVNAVDLGTMLADFRAGRIAGTACGTDPVLPDGFARFKARHGAFAAVSPDDVGFRVRRTKNKPRADLAFWTEALKTRLVQAGYKLVGEGEMPSATAGGRFLELIAPDGQRDARWLVVLFVDEGQITVVEAAGDAARLGARRDAVVKAIGAMEP